MIFLIPLSIATELRIIFRIMMETLKGVKRTGLMNLVIIGTMAAILSIFGCLFRTSLGISNFVQELGSAIEVSVYLTPGVNSETVAQNVLAIENVRKIKIIPKEQAWRELRQQMDVPDIKNPLPDTLHVKVSNQRFVESTVRKIKTVDGVEGVQYAQELAGKLEKLNDITSIATVVVLIVLGGLTLFIISNTIHLVIQARSQEIEIMRMMGVGNWYIKAPYILQGVLYGLCGALISLFPLNLLQSYLLKFFEFFQVTAPVYNTNIVILSLLMMGILVGAAGSMISIRKYMRV